MAGPLGVRADTAPCAVYGGFVVGKVEGPGRRSDQVWWVAVALVAGGTTAVLVGASVWDTGGAPVTVGAGAVMVAVALRILRSLVVRRRRRGWRAGGEGAAP